MHRTEIHPGVLSSPFAMHELRTARFPVLHICHVGEKQIVDTVADFGPKELYVIM